jgi:hypothetical protein
MRLDDDRDKCLYVMRTLPLLLLFTESAPRLLFPNCSAVNLVL